MPKLDPKPSDTGQIKKIAYDRHSRRAWRKCATTESAIPMAPAGKENHRCQCSKSRESKRWN